MISPQFQEFGYYQLAHDAAEITSLCDFFHRWLTPKNRQSEEEVTYPNFWNYLDHYWTAAQTGDLSLPIRITPEIHTNLTHGHPFPQPMINELKEARLSYSPEAYRTFMNCFVHLHQQNQLHPEFSSPEMIFSAFNNLTSIGLIGMREYQHLPQTALTLTSCLTRDLGDPQTALMPNKKLFTEPETAKEFPKAVAGRPTVLLHGRFNNFPTLGYLYAIFSTITQLEQPPNLIIGVDGDRTSTEWRSQVPFMNQIFRAGFYTFSPVVEGVFMADENAIVDLDDYWGVVYHNMPVDYLVLEEKDPHFDIKQDRLIKSTNSRGQIIITKSEHTGLPRISSSAIKTGDTEAMRVLEPQWTDLTMSLFDKYPYHPLPGFLDHGNSREPIPLPLLII